MAGPDRRQLLAGEGEIATLGVSGGAWSAARFQMAEAVAAGADPVASGKEGLRDMRIIEAIYLNARERRTLDLA